MGLMVTPYDAGRQSLRRHGASASQSATGASDAPKAQAQAQATTFCELTLGFFFTPPPTLENKVWSSHSVSGSAT